MNMDISIFTSN